MEDADSFPFAARRFIYRQCGLDPWHWIQPQPQGNHLRAIGHFHGHYVAVGRRGTILTSLEGCSWRRGASGTRNSLNSLASNGDRLVIVGNEGTVLISRDAGEWTAVIPPTARTLYYVIWAADHFWAVGEAGVILRSPDAESWTNVDAGVAATLYGIAHDAAGWVIVGADGLILTSTDGEIWQRRNFEMHGRSDLYAVCAGTQGMVAVGYGGLIVSSPDGNDWQHHPPVVRRDLYAVHFAAGRYITVGFGGTMLSRTGDGPWENIAVPTTAGLSGVMYAEGRWQAVGYYGTILGSDSGEEWAGPTGDRPGELESVTDGPDGFIAVGRDGLWASAADALSWRSLAVSVNRRLRAVEYDGRILLAVGDDGLVLRSEDGREWRQIEAGIPRNLYGLGTDGHSWLAAGEWGRIYHSVDGVNWTECATDTTQDLYAVTDGPQGWVATGRNGTLLHSRDGRQWRRHEAGTPNHLYAVAAGDTMYAAVGEGGVVTCSGDGCHWAAFGLGRRNHLEGICWSEEQWWAVGYEGIVFASLDGRTWLQLPSPAETNLYEIATNGRQLVTVGEGGVILTRPVLPAAGNTGVIYDTDHRLGELRFLATGRVPILSAMGGVGELHEAINAGYRLLPRDIAVMEAPLSANQIPDNPSPAVVPTVPPRVTEPAGDAFLARATWREAVWYANQLSRKRGWQPCYYATAKGEGCIHRHNFRETGIFCDVSADGYRLPTTEELTRMLVAGRMGMGRPLVLPGKSGGEWCWPGWEKTAGESGAERAGAVAEPGTPEIMVARRRGPHYLQFEIPPSGSRYPFRLVRTVPSTEPGLDINRLAFTPGGSAEVVFSAYHGAGQARQGLRQEEVSVALDGVETPFNIEPLSGDAPVTGVICFDTSASISASTLTEGRQLMRELLSHGAPEDRWALVNTATARPISLWTVDRQRLETRLDLLPSGGFTRLHDALVQALESLGPYPGSRHVVVLSDGRDTHSRHSMADVVRLAADSRIAVHVVGTGSVAVDPLEQLARQTGGLWFPSPKDVSLTDLRAALHQYPTGQYRIRGLTSERLLSATELRISVFSDYGLSEDIRAIPPAGPQGPPLVVTLPENLEIPAGEEVILPVSLSAPLDVLPEAWTVTAWEFTLAYDPELLQVKDLWPEGTLSEGWNVRGEWESGGLVIRAEGIRPLRDRGRLLNILLAAGAAGLGRDCARMELSRFRINRDVSAAVKASTRICLGEECIAGDVSGDGAVTVYDAQLIETFVLEGSPPDALPLCAADVTGDGEITALDAAWVRRCDSGEWTGFPLDEQSIADTDARLRMATSDLYNERDFVWRVPVVLDANRGVTAWEMVLEVREDWSLAFERSLLTDDWSLGVVRRENLWRVVMAGARPVTGGQVLFVEIRLNSSIGGRTWSDTPPDVCGMMCAYRIEENPTVE
ncbi:MAG: VWA domain-containing protein [Acidobacteria bacterium]|nr:VWA domain-containing protein [Acidobacteriota bacterium]